MPQPPTKRRWHWVCLLFAGALLPSGTAVADVLVGRVVRVADGDTVTVLDSTKTQHRIRLQGIDAPERRQPFGDVSRKHLASLLAGKTVTVEWYKRDLYRRIVGKVWVDGLDAGLEQIRAGYAWHYRFYAKEQPQKTARPTQERRRRRKRGA